MTRDCGWVGGPLSASVAKRCKRSAKKTEMKDSESWRMRSPPATEFGSLEIKKAFFSSGVKRVCKHWPAGC